MGSSGSTFWTALAADAVSEAQSGASGGVDFLSAFLDEIDKARQAQGWNSFASSGEIQAQGSSCPGGQTHAVIVGNADYSGYHPEGINLPSAGEDADNWADFYHKYGQAPSSSIKKITDLLGKSDNKLGREKDADPKEPHPGEKLILDSLKSMAANACAGDTIVFHYSGHGNGEGLLLADALSNDGLYKLKWQQIAETLSNTKAAHIVVTVDACFSNYFVSNLKFWRDHPGIAPANFDSTKWGGRHCQ